MMHSEWHKGGLGLGLVRGRIHTYLLALTQFQEGPSVFCLFSSQLNGSSAAGKAGLLPTRRGLGGNISLGDIITTLNGTKVLFRPPTHM